MTIRDQIDRALRRVRQLYGDRVEYRRGAIVFTVTAFMGGETIRGTEQNGRVVETRRDTARIGVTDLAVLGNPRTGSEPLPDDVLIWDVAGRRRTFRVVPDDENRCWTWSDHQQTQYVINVAEMQESAI